MSEAAIPVLGKLVARVSMLEIGGAHDAAHDLLNRTLAEFGSMDDEGVRVTFATFLGFFSGFAMAHPTPEAVRYLDLFENAARAPARAEVMRATVETVLSVMRGQSEEPTCS